MNLSNGVEFNDVITGVIIDKLSEYDPSLRDRPKEDVGRKCSNGRILGAIADINSIPVFLKVKDFVERTLLEQFDPRVMTREMFVPLRLVDGQLFVAVANPWDAVPEDICYQKFPDCEVIRFVTPVAEISKVIESVSRTTAVSRSDLSYDPLANSFAQAAPTVTIYAGNPYIPAALAATLNPGDSFGFLAYWGNEQSSHVDERTDFWQATAGIDAEIGSNWKASLSYTHADSKHKMDQSDLWDWRKTLAAVDVVSVNGVPTCRVLTTSFASAFSGCQPMNVFNGAPISTSPAGYAYATGTSSYRANFKHDSVVGTISGSLFELPAGPIDVVVGAEYRHQSFNLTSNADPATLDTAAERNAYFAGVTDRGLLGSMLYYWLTNVGTGRGSLKVKEVFGEVAVPILAGTPGAEELSINGAVRLTDYSTSGSVTTWKLGGIYKPIPDVLLRATYSRDIRAPNLYELFRGDQSGIGIVLDPVTGLNQNVSTVSGGNLDLKPEVAKTLTIGGVLQPSFLPGFSFAVDYYRIRLKGAIDSLSSTQILNNCFNFGPNTPECALITRPSPSEFPSLVRISEANIAFLNTTGIDFDASYRTQVGDAGALSLRLYANYLDKFDTQAYEGQPVIH